MRSGESTAFATLCREAKDTTSAASRNAPAIAPFGDFECIGGIPLPMSRCSDPTISDNSGVTDPMVHRTLTIKHGTRDRALDALLLEEEQRIVSRLSGIPHDRVSLHAELDQNPHRHEAYSSLTLDLGDRRFNAHGRGRNFPMALRHAFHALIAELTRWRERHRAH